MPFQNRVDPQGALHAVPARGAWIGNRGVLHDESRRIVKPWRLQRWIVCALEFKGRHREVFTPGRWTELFFLDEATAFAAGHRPCALCRREDYDRFRQLFGAAGAPEINERLHLERVDPITRAHRLHDARLDELPDGAFVLHERMPRLVLGDALLRWTPAGYSERTARPKDARATLITPPSLVHVLRAGWQGAVPLLHPSAT